MINNNTYMIFDHFKCLHNFQEFQNIDSIKVYNERYKDRLISL